MLPAVVEQVVLWADLGVLVYFVLLNSFYAVLLFSAIPELYESTHLAEDIDFARIMRSEALPPVAVLAPAYNEGVTIATSVTALLALQYPAFEVIVINDGSSDGTMDVLREAFDLYEVPPVAPPAIATRPVRAYYRSRTRPRLAVIDKENGGKADALNAGINASRFPYVIAVDADTIVEQDALLRMMRPFLLGNAVAAAGGTVRVANACTVEHGVVKQARVSTAFLPAIQVVEYLRAFLFGRLGWNRIGSNLIISGAFGMFHRGFLLEIGGYHPESVVEDLDLVVRLQRHLRQRRIQYHMPFIPDPVAWTEVPSTLKVLGRQRERWHRGLISSMWLYRGMLLNPRYGRLGWVAMPFYCFGEMLAPVVEVLGYAITALGLGFGLIHWPFAGMFFLVAWGYGMLLSLGGVALEEASFRRYQRFGDVLRLVLYATAENFGYRQLTVWWRLRGFWSVFRRRKAWGVMTRTGFATK
jgi:cellulose synthase/poly-beta-1,6-N-acetylglucosamine synthase-like glycosyltransferase